MKRCEVVCDTAAAILSCTLELPDRATIEDAVTAARARLGEAAADWQAAVGVFGTVKSRGYVWREGDRIELYRALQLDPRTRRRQRAAQSDNNPSDKNQAGRNR